MNKSLRELFDVNLSDEEIQDYFEDTQWEDNVADAAFFGAILLSNKIDRNPEEIIHEIVSYNVLKRLRELFISKSKPLPKEMFWDSALDQTEAYYLLENYVAQAVILKQAEKFENTLNLKLKITDLNIKRKLKQWCLNFQEKYKSEIKITCKKVKSDYLITIE